jgi:hypothetical protein
MSAIATPAATPPRAAAPEGGRLKRKAKVPERFQSPPPAKRVRVQPPVRAKKPGNGEKHVEKHVAAKRAGKGGKPPRAPAQRHQAYAPVPPADTGVNAMALAALSSPSAAALLGQSPVPEAIAERAMRDASAALAADRSGGLAGLALLLAASSGSPFRADLALAEGQCAPRGHKAKGRVAAEAAATRDAPRDAGAGRSEGARRRRAVHAKAPEDAEAPDDFPVERTKRLSKPSKPSLAKKQTELSRDVSSLERRRSAATPAAPAGEENAQPSLRPSSLPPPPLGGCESAAAALARGDAAAPAAILKHALRWIDLVVADLKGRAAALRRSRRRLQRVKQDTELAQVERADEDETLEEEKTLLRDMDRALASESRGVDAQLRAAAELRALAAGDRAKAMKAFEAAAAAAEATCDDSAPAGAGARGRGRPKGSAGAEKAVVGPRFAEIAATLRGEGNPPEVRTGAPDPAGEAFERCSLAMAEAFLKTGLDVAVAERAGDAEKAAAAACPANLVPTPHVPRLATA